jgi:hypothetical protein
MSAIYIGKSMAQISELLQMVSDRLMVGNRKDLRCFICTNDTLTVIYSVMVIEYSLEK